ncbi:MULTISPECIES: hypothetical protein [unclassified Streptosporangium]|uniref:hypothetical protein n=1 Tax=Streptosporangium sp. NPDC005286 TaxID=3154463 RepID=UPI0033BF3D3F
MHPIRVSGFFVMLTSALAIACAPVPAAMAATSHTTLHADPPEEETCPNGQPKPCGAQEERGGVDADREETKKDTAKAKEDIAEAKKKVEECPPTSKQCMENLIGDGGQQRKDLDDTRQALANFRPAPSDNAASAIAETCDEFAAGLPAALRNSPDFSQLTGVCELMNP